MTGDARHFAHHFAQYFVHYFVQYFAHYFAHYFVQYFVQYFAHHRTSSYRQPPIRSWTGNPASKRSIFRPPLDAMNQARWA